MVREKQNTQKKSTPTRICCSHQFCHSCYPNETRNRVKSSTNVLTHLAKARAGRFSSPEPRKGMIRPSTPYCQNHDDIAPDTSNTLKSSRVGQRRHRYRVRLPPLLLFSRRRLSCPPPHRARRTFRSLPKVTAGKKKRRKVSA